jgi:hypothetical protein
MPRLWLLALALGVRIGLWSFLSPARLASDEDSYLRAGSLLLTTGQQDLFWPPGTGWLIAFIGWITGSTDARWIRLAWVAMDILCLVAVRILAGRAGQALGGDDDRRHANRIADAATLAYALYLPAISFSQFTTSEIPSLLLVLWTLVLVTGTLTTARFAAAGALAGALVITRPSLLPLLVFLPGAVVVHQRHRQALTAAIVFVTVAVGIVLAVIVRNYTVAGEATISHNSAYNLYIGNQDLYAEDLDLFHPVATSGQIEFRRQFFAGELTYPTQSPDELQQEALVWIQTHPGIFARRALGRLARVFAPKTDVLELLGGERAAGILARRSLLLLAITNLQWAVVLFAGLIGLAALRRLHRPLGDLFIATVLGSLPLCLIAIAKPRYAFAFEPVLLIAAVVVCVAPRRVLDVLRARDRWIVVACAAFLVWGWTAWLVFAISSRVALASGS